MSELLQRAATMVKHSIIITHCYDDFIHYSVYFYVKFLQIFYPSNYVYQ